MSARALAMLVLIALGAGCAGHDRLPPAPTVLPANVHAVGPGAYVFESGRHRSLFVVGREGVIVTDPLEEAAARDYLAAVRVVTDRPVRYVVYSHNHRDRILGAAVFSGEGAEVVAHARCPAFFAANPDERIVPPDRSYDEALTLDVGGASLELRHFGPAHSDCLSVMQASPAGVMQIVDLVDIARPAFPEDPLVPNIRPHNLREFFAAVDAWARESGTVAVVSSSTRDQAPLTGPPDVIAAQRRFWELVYDTVEAAEARGAIGNDSMPRLRPEEIEPFRAWDGFDREALGFIMRRIVAYEAMGR